MNVNIVPMHLRLVDPMEGKRGELELNVALSRRFQCIGDNEPIELTAFTDGPICVAHATDAQHHIRLLRDAHNLRGFRGAYQLVNGPMNPDLVYRYEPNTWSSAKPGRATDRDIQTLRALFIDVDPVRPKNISSTDEQLRAAWEVSHRLERWFAELIGDDAGIGHGCSGNGYFTLVALEPIEPSADTSKRISEFLRLLHRKFGDEQTKIDTSRGLSNERRYCCRVTGHRVASGCAVALRRVWFKPAEGEAAGAARPAS